MRRLCVEQVFMAEKKKDRQIIDEERWEKTLIESE